MSASRKQKPESARKVLIVDDEPDLVRMVADRLEFHGFEVVTAGDGLEGIKKIEQEVPDLVLLDVLMPGMDGFQVLEKIKKTRETRGIPVIMLTAKGQAEDVARAHAIGVADYIVKPFDYAALVTKIKNCLKGK